MINEKKPNFILDLDQTLISAEPIDTYDKKNNSKAKKFSFQKMEDYYIVFERPYLQKFLDYLFKNFNVSIWTAASKDYALFIIEKIILQNKPERKLDWIFFSYHCDLSKKIKKNSKTLQMLWDVYNIQGYSEDNTVILDDYVEVYNTQKNNCIMAVPFEFLDDGSENDDFLLRLIPHLTDMKKHIMERGNKPAKMVNKIMSKKDAESLP